MEKIKVGDIIFAPNGLFFICENKKHEKWMNWPEFPGRKATKEEIDSLPKTYFGKKITGN